MATVRRRASGRWQVIVQARQPDGTRRQESRMFDSEQEARLYAHRLEYDVRSGAISPDRATVRQLCDLWLQVRIREKPSTISAYRQALKVACTQLGGIQARQLDVIQCERAWATLLATYSSTYVRQQRSCLSQVLRWAQLAGVVTSNPAAASTVRTPRQRGTLDEPAVLTPHELATVLEHPQDPPWPTMWRLLADTGLRQGEARALRWRNIDLKAGTVQVVATRTLADMSGRGTETDGPPKSEQSRRTVPLTSQAAGALAEHRAWQAGSIGLETVAKDAHVFYGPPSRRVLGDAWRELRAATGLRDELTPHSLRHTYASSLLVAGVPIVRVAALCGHTVHVCARTYAHWVGGTDHEAAAVLERSRRLADR